MGTHISGPVPPSHAQLMERVRAIGTQAMQQAVLETEREWKLRAERSRRTGTYMRSITSRVVQVANGVRGYVGSAVPQARWLEQGTGLYGPEHHWIVPKQASVLRFPAGGGGSHGFSATGAPTGFTPSAGFRATGQQRQGAAGGAASFVFAKRVRGIRPRRFAHDAAFVVRPKVLLTFKRAGLAMAQAWGGMP